MDTEKFIQRVENMLLSTCGCTKEEAIIILEKSLEKLRNTKYAQIKLKEKQEHEKKLKEIEKWARYIKEHSDEEWSEQQNMLIDSVIS